MWLSKRQTSTSRSTTEAEVISFANALFSDGLPMLDLFELIFGRKMCLEVQEDNQATIKILQKGYSPKLRHVPRVHKVNLGSVTDLIDQGAVSLAYCYTEDQAADIFTKSLQPNKWPNALALLGIGPQVISSAAAGFTQYLTFFAAACTPKPFTADSKRTHPAGRKGESKISSFCCRFGCHVGTPTVVADGP